MEWFLRTVVFGTGTIARGKRRAIVFACLLFCSELLFNAAFTSVCWSRSDSGLTVRVMPAVQDVALGQVFIVEVVVDGTADLGAFEFHLVYDPAMLTVERVELGSFLGSTGRTVQPIAARSTTRQVK